MQIMRTDYADSGYPEIRKSGTRKSGYPDIRIPKSLIHRSPGTLLSNPCNLFFNQCNPVEVF